MTSSNDHANHLWCEDRNSAAEIIDSDINKNDERETEKSFKGTSSDTNVVIESNENAGTAILHTTASPKVTSAEEHGDLSNKRKAGAYGIEDSSFSVTEAASAIVNDVTQGLENTVENPLATITKKRVRRTVPARISWEERIASLKAYKEEHGDLNIPIRYKQNPSLGKFVHNTREQFKLYHHQCKPGYQKRCCLTAERIATLNEIGFLWTTERAQKQNDDWASRLEQLKEYKAKHGVRMLTCIKTFFLLS
jgi:Helicase associated domain